MCFLWYFQEYNQTSENIFRKFFWNATKHMKTFSFPENSISEKYLFSGNAFTRTKRSLICSEFFSVFQFLCKVCPPWAHNHFKSICKASHGAQNKLKKYLLWAPNHNLTLFVLGFHSGLGHMVKITLGLDLRFIYLYEEKCGF